MNACPASKTGALASVLMGAALALLPAPVRGDVPPPQAEPLLNELAAPTPTTPLEELVTRSSPRNARKGYASYYARRFDGRRTTSGHRYRPEKLTAAHHSLPLGTVVRVVNPATNQEVQVTVNDRCARKPYPFIDLSRAAAQKIGLYGKGRMAVLIIPLEEPT